LNAFKKHFYIDKTMLKLCHLQSSLNVILGCLSRWHTLGCALLNDKLIWFLSIVFPKNKIFVLVGLNFINLFFYHASILRKSLLTTVSKISFEWELCVREVSTGNILVSGSTDSALSLIYITIEEFWKESWHFSNWIIYWL
jgi:hypothetical protein